MTHHSPSQRGSLGPLGERLASHYLRNNKIKILHQNWNCFIGEIDLIGLNQEFLIFFEVKTRSNLNKGHPLESITLKKQKQVIDVAKIFIQDHPHYQHLSFRFDVVSILLNQSQPQIEWIANAFGEI